MTDPIQRIRLFTYLILTVLLVCIGVVSYVSIKAEDNKEVRWGFKAVKDGAQYRDISSTHNEIDFGPFTIEAPKDFYILQMTRPYDSYVGGLTNGHDEIMFDYGRHSPDISQFASRDTVNGQIVYYKHPKKGEKDNYAMALYEFDLYDKLYISSTEPVQAEVLEQIFKSLKIKKKFQFEL